jgi:hypothetical protein
LCVGKAVMSHGSLYLPSLMYSRSLRYNSSTWQCTFKLSPHTELVNFATRFGATQQSANVQLEKANKHQQSMQSVVLPCPAIFGIATCRAGCCSRHVLRNTRYVAQCSCWESM